MTPTPGRVIVGISDSVTGLRALRLGVAEARRRGAELHAVRAWLPQRNPGLAPISAAAAQADQATALVGHVFDDIGGEPADLIIVTATPEGAPGPTLVSYADGDDDLLVMGASPRRLRRSVARFCVTHATCPVLAVPPDHLARQHRRATHALRRDIAALERQGG